MASLVSVGCGGGGGDSCDGLGGLSIACADFSDVGPGFDVDPEVQAQVDEFYNSLKQKSPFFNQNVMQTSEKYESLTGIYQSDHQSENYIAQFYAISPKGYIVQEHSAVGNLFSEPNDYFSMIFLPSSFSEISITTTAGGEILQHARTSASFGGFNGPYINTSDEQVTYVSAGTDNQIWDGFDFLNGHDIDLNSNVLGTPLRPGIYWSPVVYSVEYSQDGGNLVVESVLMLELSQNGSVTAIEDEFEEQLAIGVNGTCKINGMIDGPPDNLTLDTNFVLDASIIFESCYFSDSYGSAKTILYPDSSYSTDNGSNANDSLSDVAIIKTVLIPFDNLTEFDLFNSLPWTETGRGFKLVSGFSREEHINIESVAPYFFELCNPDGTLSLQILEDDGYVCQYDPDEEMLVPIPR